MILGIDEVGRGPWAGPLVVGAIVLGDAKIKGLNDSKKLSAKKRSFLAVQIKKSARGIGIGWVSASTIDKIGLSAALKLASKRAMNQIDCKYDEIIIDGTIKLVDEDNVTTMPKADGLIAAVSAASIIAKVARDDYMIKLDKVFPGYNFAHNVGYGTKDHQLALEENGITPIHRQSFAPIKKLALSSRCYKKTKVWSGSTSLSTTNIGNSAESVAEEFLASKDHEIIARNWKTKYCEIDIISIKDEVLYFTEVKYRKNDRAGGGIEAITKKKENQMRFAAKFYLESNELDEKIDAVLSVISLTGNPPVVETYIKNIK